MLANGDGEAAEIVATDYDCCLRGGEWFTIRAGDVDVEEGGDVAIRLGILERGEQTKTGPRQGVVPELGFVRELLRARKARRQPDERLWSLSKKAFYAAWGRATAAVGIDLPPHSLRHSAAAEAIRQGGFSEGAVRATQLRGRWKQISSLRRYAQPHLLVSARAGLSADARTRGEAFWNAPRRAFGLERP